MTKLLLHKNGDAVCRERQKGVALIIVLLMTASLSFIALGVTARMTQSIERTRANIDKTSAYWRAVSVEPVAAVAIEQLTRPADNRGRSSSAAATALTPLSPLFLKPLTVPLPDGTAEAAFIDGTRCFNLNSLNPRAIESENNEEDNQTNGANPSNQPSNENNQDGEGDGGGPAAEFRALAIALGIPGAEAERIAAVIIDWMDADGEPQLNGAEDNFYTALPEPFRTGGARLADVSEIRAMDGVTREIYLQLRPFLCALPSSKPSVVNVNMLEARHAPILVALTQGRVSLNQARDVIERRPPGGWESIDQFWSEAALERLKTSQGFQQTRTALTSRYIAVQARLSINEIDMVETLVFRIANQSGSVQLISREFGAPL